MGTILYLIGTALKISVIPGYVAAVIVGAVTEEGTSVITPSKTNPVKSPTCPCDECTQQRARA